MHKEQFPPAQDVVIMARWAKGAKGALPPLNYRDLCLELESLLKKIPHA